MRAEPYSEERAEHQEPVAAISQWQEWNDMDDRWSAGVESDYLQMPMREAMEFLTVMNRP